MISALNSTRNLTELDISGHQIGDTGAVALAKTLQTNNSLMRLVWDGNDVTLLG